MLIFFVGLAGCGDGNPASGPGPVGPVGPLDPVGSPDESDGALVGSGEVVSESRAVSGFDRVALVGEGDVVIQFEGSETLTIQTDANLLDSIDSLVRDRTLEIRTAEGVDIAPTASVRYRVGVRELTGIELAGSGSFEIDRWSTRSSDIAFVGVGDIRIASLASDELVVEQTGVGAITIGGDARDQSITITGTGEYRAGDLHSETAAIEIAGASAATVWVDDTLRVAASDASTVSYYGAPELNHRLSDLATIEPLGQK